MLNYRCYTESWKLPFLTFVSVFIRLKVAHYQLMRYKAVRAFVQRREYLTWPEDPQDLEWFYERLVSQILKDTKLKKVAEEPDRGPADEDGVQLQAIRAAAVWTPASCWRKTRCWDEDQVPPAGENEYYQLQRKGRQRQTYAEPLRPWTFVGNQIICGKKFQLCIIPFFHVDLWSVSNFTAFHVNDKKLCCCWNYCVDWIKCFWLLIYN